MNDCQQHSPVAIEWITTVIPPTGRFKWWKEGILHDAGASRVTYVTKLKCFACGEMVEIEPGT